MKNAIEISQPLRTYAAYAISKIKSGKKEIIVYQTEPSRPWQARFAPLCEHEKSFLKIHMNEIKYKFAIRFEQKQSIFLAKKKIEKSKRV